MSTVLLHKNISSLCMISLVLSGGQCPLLCVQVSEENTTLFVEVQWAVFRHLALKFLLELKKWSNQICTKVTRYFSANVLKKLRAHKRPSGRCFSEDCRCVQVSTMTLRGPGDASHIIWSNLTCFGKHGCEWKPVYTPLWQKTDQLGTNRLLENLPPRVWWDLILLRFTRITIYTKIEIQCFIFQFIY